MNLEMETSIVLGICWKGKGEYLHCPAGLLGFVQVIHVEQAMKLEACKGSEITPEPCTKSALLSEATRATSSP